jgi:hypothetical protein
MKVLNEYPNSHHYWDEYIKTELFCPNCGKQCIWSETGAGDYYVGSDFVCIECGNFFYMLDSGTKPQGENEENKIKQIISGVTSEPSTPKGH